MKSWIAQFCVIAFLAIGCTQRSRQSNAQTATATAERAALNSRAAMQFGNNVDPLQIILAPHIGTNRIDLEIIQLQSQVCSAKHPQPILEKLGWAFVHKARQSLDPGFYKLAEQCALCIEQRQPHSPEALLLRGHVLQNLHRFKEAEPLARELVAERGLAFDFGLLGDVLMEQGRLDEAVVAYQKMADLRPDLQAYARAAHMRWLKGDLEGALEMMQLAVDSASPRDGETAAWVNTRMALYELQSGDLFSCRQHCEAALQFQKNYPPALLARGRLLLAVGKTSDAIDALERAEALNPLPEYQWVLSEALRADGRVEEALAIERKLRERGASADPRTFALYLATRGENSSTAIQLAQAELKTRADVLTLDALAWSLAAGGDWSEAAQQSKHALAEGTRDARLFLHAGIIAAKTGDQSKAQEFLGQAAALRPMLLPSEQTLLADYSTKVLTRAVATAFQSVR